MQSDDETVHSSELQMNFNILRIKLIKLSEYYPCVCGISKYRWKLIRDTEYNIINNNC